MNSETSSSSLVNSVVIAAGVAIVLSFFMSFIPSVGFLISVIPPAIMTLIQFGVTEMLVVIVLYIVINFIVDNVIKPLFIEEGVNISVTVTFLSLIVWCK